MNSDLDVPVEKAMRELRQRLENFERAAKDCNSSLYRCAQDLSLVIGHLEDIIESLKDAQR